MQTSNEKCTVANMSIRIKHDLYELAHKPGFMINARLDSHASKFE